MNPRPEWLQALLGYVNHFCSELDRDRVIGAVFEASGGSETGLCMADDWCRRRSDYAGPEALMLKWQSLRCEPDLPNGFELLCTMVEEYGFDPLEICSATEPGFEPCDVPEDLDGEQQINELDEPFNALTRYSLRGHRDEVARTAGDQVHILGRLALSNQLTAIYGAPGVGKSLVVMSLIVAAITQGKINARAVFYLDFDTNPNGLLEKIDIAERYGFNVLSDGYFEFTSRKFLEVLDELIATNQAAGTIVVLDTLKKFVSIMDKERSSSFASRLRRFSKAGGACVALAHVNKHRNADGRPVYAGTSDILEDFDCAYLMYQVAIDADAQTRTIVFENIKGRGDVAKLASYRYSISEGQAYSDLLQTVTPLDEAELTNTRRSEEVRSDAVLIEAIKGCIRSGIVTKMLLAETTATRTKTSKRAALAVIDRYCGTDPARHLWNYAVHERGAKKYSLLNSSATDDCNSC